jgi:hypothetical protein
MKTLESVRAELETMFPVCPEIGCFGTAPTGEKYREITSGMRGAKFDTQQEAIDVWAYRIMAYAHEHKGMLYWRIEPEIDSYNGFWRVYSRLLISDKPVLFSEPPPKPTDEPVRGFGGPSQGSVDHLWGNEVVCYDDHLWRLGPLSLSDRRAVQEFADLLGNEVVCYDMYGKEIGRAQPRGSKDGASVSPAHESQG